METTYQVTEESRCGNDPFVDPHRRLLAAVIRRAVQDAARSNGYSAEAQQWLRSRECRHYLELLGIDHSFFEKMVKRED